jgi:uncharacterized LabA/DUF88 family protein
MYYFTAVGENRESSPVLGLVDWLDRNGYNTITKPIRTQYSGDTKGNIDIEIAVTMLRAAHRGYMDRAVLFSGDSDFRCLIEEVQNLGSKVTVVSTLTVKPIPCADELIRQADHFCDLDSLRSLTFRDPHATVRGNRRSNHDP